ncbi:MAG: DUF3341 domain-containing protein [Acidobacteriota bacterium]
MSEPRLSVVAEGPKLYGLLAEFDSVGKLLAAAERVREAGFTRFDAHSPIPVHGLDEAMGIRPSRLPLLVLGGGASGLGAGLLLQWWTNAVDYPFMISGKPLFGLPAAIPVTFELTILLSALGVVGGLVVANGWPQFHHPLFASERFRRATTDRFFVSVEAADPRFELETVRGLLESAGASHVEEVED